LSKEGIPERGARMARRDDREYREYLREEQRRQPGCPARKALLDQPIQATGLHMPTIVDPVDSRRSHSSSTSGS